MANGALPKSSGEGETYLRGGSAGSFSHTSEGSDGNAGQHVSPRSWAPGQAGAGANQWSLQQHPWDILGIPRSAFTTPVSGRPSWTPGQSTRATADPARAQGPAQQPAVEAHNARVGVPEPPYDPLRLR
ncbi:hypothetical protein KVR01_006903 [Diaporthe batatas]|uniref:uncharacterized protein n=1 Tax=Diaporthe batatas TaxID=748121 RepID=UPI001D03FA28|nr:uncharacterized protein KVR01_006903 [Diaporthe batatas]KAG8163606.1 hypothetical protein KVR01_006903 [Diaporthe batatas]